MHSLHILDSTISSCCLRLITDSNMNSSLLETLLSFDYVLTIILNNVWTCMAILTAAAISFIWTTLKSSSSSSSLSPRFEKASSPSASPHQEPNVVHSCSQKLSEAVPKNVNSTRALDCTDGVIKRGKFAVYYYYDDEVQEEDYYRENVVSAETEYENVTDGSVTFCCRELNMGWYRYLDFTVFSGNVVKLWD